MSLHIQLLSPSLAYSSQPHLSAPKCMYRECAAFAMRAFKRVASCMDLGFWVMSKCLRRRRWKGRHPSCVKKRKEKKGHLAAHTERLSSSSERSVAQ